MSDLKTLTALPVYNEAKHLLNVLSEVRKYSQDVLVVDDGSSDGTAELLDAQADLFVIHHPKNRGYGAGLRSAFEFAQQHEYDAIVTIDCDGQHQPCLIPELAASLESPEPVDIVSGSRYLQSFAGGHSTSRSAQSHQYADQSIDGTRVGAQTDRFVLWV